MGYKKNSTFEFAKAVAFEAGVALSDENIPFMAVSKGGLSGFPSIGPHAHIR